MEWGARSAFTHTFIHTRAQDDIPTKRRPVAAATSAWRKRWDALTPGRRRCLTFGGLALLVVVVLAVALGAGLHGSGGEQPSQAEMQRRADATVEQVCLCEYLHVFC